MRVKITITKNWVTVPSMDKGMIEVRSSSLKNIIVPEYGITNIPTSIILTPDIPARIKFSNKTGFAKKYGITIINGSDHDFEKEVLVVVKNVSDKKVVIKPGDIIGYMYVVPEEDVEYFTEIDG